jgi:alanine racemase
VKQLDAGEKINYGGEYTTTQTEWIGTIPVGYADGWHQQFRTTGVLVDGKRVPIIGRIAMDQLMVALPQKYPVEPRVTFIGQRGNEIFSSLSSRLPRIYTQDGSIISIRNSMLDTLSLP